MRYQVILVRMAIIKKSRNNKCWSVSGEKGTLLHCWWECKLVQPLWRTIWRFLKKKNKKKTLKIELPYNPAIPLLGIYPEKIKTLIQKDTCTPIFIAALFTIAKRWRRTQCPSTDEWIKFWYQIWSFPIGSVVKNLPATQETWVQFLGRKDPLEKGMATHSSILAWRMPWTEKPSDLQS